MSTLANGEDLEEMQHNAVFHLGLHFVLHVRLKKIFRSTKTS